MPTAGNAGGIQGSMYHGVRSESGGMEAVGLRSSISDGLTSEEHGEREGGEDFGDDRTADIDSRIGKGSSGPDRGLEPKTGSEDEDIINHRFRSCESKRPYDSRKVARSERRKLQLRFGKKYTIYKCKFCRNFHLATKK